MVQGGFYGGFKGSFYGNNGDKTKDSFGSGFIFGGNRAGFKEGDLLPIIGGDRMSKNHGSAVKTDVGKAAAGEHPLRHKRIKYHHMGIPVTSTTTSQSLSLQGLSLHSLEEPSPLGSVTSTTPSQGLSLHPLDEPSPLGLTLKKTPSFIELIQMNLSQGVSAVPLVVKDSSIQVGRKKDPECARRPARPAIADKQKATNFPALMLRIGSWEHISRYEGDLVAKCYFAKRKLVWEVLDGGLKSKIEIQWSYITSLKASFPDNEPGTLEIEVSRPPLFFRETDPQPRKHTVWQATSDFTGEQASICRRHLLQFAEGILERHYEKLLQCDDRLNLLSKEGIMGEDSPYFDSWGTVFQNQNEQSCYGAAHENKSPLFPQFDHPKDSYLPPFSSLTVAGTPRVSSLLQQIKPPELDGRVLDVTPQDTPSPCSVMDSWTTEESGISDADDLHVNGTAKCDQMIFAAHYGGLRNRDTDFLSTKSMDTLANRTVSYLSEKFSHNSVPTGEQTWQENKKIDSLLSASCDGQKVNEHVNSMYSLIEKDVSAAHASNGNTKSVENSGAGYGLGRLVKGEDDGQVCERNDDMTEAVLGGDDRVNCQVNGMESGHNHCKQSTTIPREDSFTDLLVNIPRIASFPPLFVDSSDEFFTSAEQLETAGWNFFNEM